MSSVLFAFSLEKCLLCIEQHLQQCMELIPVLSSMFLYALLHLLTLQAHAGSIFVAHSTKVNRYGYKTKPGLRFKSAKLEIFDGSFGGMFMHNECNLQVCDDGSKIFKH